MQLSARAIAQILGGSVEGDPEVLVNRPGKIEEGGEGVLTFLGNPKYEAFAYTTTASILLVSRQFEPRQPIAATLIRVDDVYQAMTTLLEQFGERALKPIGISDQASVHPAATIASDVSIEAFAVVEANARIGAGSRIGAQAYIGENVEIGLNTLIYSGVRILHNCKIGDNCILHANAVIGSDGFGFAPQPDGRYRKITHTGNVIIENDVEIGANTTIDRATIGSTIIRQGVKLDNLVHVAHNVEIGEHTVIAAQTGIAGSTRIGKNCRIGGQVGFAGHVQIADGSQIQAQSGIASNIKEPNQAWFGYPAIPYNNYVRSFTIFKKLPELYKLLLDIDKRTRK